MATGVDGTSSRGRYGTIVFSGDGGVSLVGATGVGAVVGASTVVTGIARGRCVVERRGCGRRRRVVATGVLVAMYGLGVTAGSVVVGIGAGLAATTGAASVAGYGVTAGGAVSAGVGVADGAFASGFTNGGVAGMVSGAGVGTGASSELTGATGPKVVIGVEVSLVVVTG